MVTLGLVSSVCPCKQASTFPIFYCALGSCLHGYGHQLPCPVALTGISQWGAPGEEKEDSEDYLCSSLLSNSRLGTFPLYLKPTMITALAAVIFRCYARPYGWPGASSHICIK